MVFTVKLLPEGSLGRMFQIAALGVGSSLSPVEAYLDLQRGVVDLPSQDSYVELVKSVLEFLAGIDVFNKCDGGLEALREKPCECLELPGPSFYFVGIPDEKRLERIGLANVKCPLGKRSKRVSTWWNTASLEYALRVLDAGAPLSAQGCQKTTLVALAKASFYEDRVRAPASVTQRKDETTYADCDSLGLALLGGSLSFVARVQEKQGSYEFYLAPAANEPREAGEVYLAYQSRNDRGESLRGVLEQLLQNLDSASTPLLASLASAAHIADLVEKAYSLGGRLSHYYVVVSAGRKPNIVDAIPVNVEPLIAAYSGDTLRLYADAAREAARLSKARGDLREKAERAKSILGSCLGSLHMYPASCNPDLVYRCVRELEAVAASLERDGAPRLSGLLRRLARRLSWDAIEYSESCG